MQIMVRHESAQEVAEGTEAHPARTCVWIIGADGGTRETAYLEPGEVLPIDLPGDLDYHFGPLGLTSELPAEAPQAGSGAAGEVTP